MKKNQKKQDFSLESKKQLGQVLVYPVDRKHYQKLDFAELVQKSILI